jgi:5'-nucleotidase / UDP-sugar diphosphatase
MKKSLAIISVGFLMISVLSGQSGKKLTIIHTNDMHSRLTGYAPELSYTPLTTNDDKTTGGFARIASILKSEKNSSSGTTLVVDAGDFLMGTLFQALEPSSGFQLKLMKKMGYDVVCLGNHEFDFGPAKLAAIIKASSTGDGIPGILLSNAVSDDEDPADDELTELFTKDIIRRKLIMEKDGMKIGFFSLMGVVADENAAYARPVSFAKQLPAAKKMVKELEDEGCNVIICLSHSGVTEGKSGEWTGEDVDLARKVKGIDVIISGHTHTRLDKPLIINGVPVVQTGEYGQNVGKLSLTVSDGKVTLDSYSLITVDDRIAGDPVINSLIEDQKKVVTGQILKPLDMEYDKPLAESEFLLECDEEGDIRGSNLGPLVADAIYSYVNRHVNGGTDIAMVAVGVIRDKIVPGLQTAPDIFRIMSMGRGNDNIPGYPLSKVHVTGHELKSILEILLLAGNSTPENYCYFSGIRVEYNPDKGLLKKIRKVEIIHPDGTASLVDFSKKNSDLYSITANSYMLEFIGIIRKMSKGLINVVPKDSAGKPVLNMNTAVMDFDQKSPGTQEGKEWLAIIEYLSGMKDINGNGVPDVDQKYRSAIQSFFDVSPKK